MRHRGGRRSAYSADEGAMFHGVLGIRAAGFASGETTSTAVAPRKAPVRECVTIG